MGNAVFSEDSAFVLSATVKTRLANALRLWCAGATAGAGHVREAYPSHALDSAALVELQIGFSHTIRSL